MVDGQLTSTVDIILMSIQPVLPTGLCLTRLPFKMDQHDPMKGVQNDDDKGVK